MARQRLQPCPLCACGRVARQARRHPLSAASCSSCGHTKLASTGNAFFRSLYGKTLLQALLMCLPGRHGRYPKRDPTDQDKDFKMPNLQGHLHADCHVHGHAGEVQFTEKKVLKLPMQADIPNPFRWHLGQATKLPSQKHLPNEEPTSCSDLWLRKVHVNKESGC